MSNGREPTSVVGEQFPEKGKQTEQGRQCETAVAILNVGGGDDAVQQQALSEHAALPLACRQIDAPPFFRLFTL